MSERHTRWVTVFRKTNGTEEHLGRHKCETPTDVRNALALSAAHVFDFPHERGPVLKGDFVETVVAKGDADGSMFGVVGIRPCRNGEWDTGEHEGCGKDTERAVRRYA